LILLGLLLLLLGAGIGTITYLAATSQSERIHIAAYGFARDASALELVLLGAGTAFVLAVGWAYVAAWLRRQARLRREDEEDARLDELDSTHAEALAEKDRQLAQAAAREQELTHQVRELSVREAELGIRARELSLRESQWQDRVGTFDTDVSMPRLDEGPWGGGPGHGDESSEPAAWNEGPSRPVLRRRRAGA
jgi:hypothetical protein